jgi:hypothetical protein
VPSLEVAPAQRRTVPVLPQRFVRNQNPASALPANLVVGPKCSHAPPEAGNGPPAVPALPRLTPGRVKDQGPDEDRSQQEQGGHDDGRQGNLPGPPADTLDDKGPAAPRSSNLHKVPGLFPEDG